MRQWASSERRFEQAGGREGGREGEGGREVEGGHNKDVRDIGRKQDSLKTLQSKR